jgi:hypothetical protein
MSADLLTAGKSPAMLSKPGSIPEQDALFVNERIDQLDLCGKKINHALFVGVAFKKATLRNVDFSHSTFVRCYFRNAEFSGCTLTGCQFVDCDFPRARFGACNLEYSRWKNCTKVDVESILDNMPEWPNVRRDLLESLRTNALSVGDGASARKLFFKAMDAASEHHRRVRNADSGYYKKYGIGQRIRSATRCVLIATERLGWGFGENPLRFALAGAIGTLAFALLYSLLAPDAFGYDDTVPGIAIAFSKALRLSVLTFTMNSPKLPGDVSLWFSSWHVVESMSGAVFASMLAAMVYRWISIRQAR